MERIQGDEPRDLGYRLLDTVRSSFQASGWAVHDTHDNNDVDLFVARDSKRYLITLKVAREGRRQQLESLWANAYLRARAAATEYQGEPLPMVGTAVLSDRMVEDLKTYFRRYAPGVAFGLIDARGRIEFSGTDLPDQEYALERPPVSDGLFLKARPQDLFSDLNQWMLKVLLARRLHPSLLAAPRRRIRKATELAEAAEVSVPSAHRLLTALKEEGFLAIQGQAYEIVYTDVLLQRWQQASLVRQIPEMPMRFLFAHGSADVQMRKALSTFTARRLQDGAETGEPLSWEGGRAALGLFSAARELDLGFVQGAAAHLYLEDESARDLKSLGLTPAHPGEDVHVFIRRPRYKESTFRGVAHPSGIPATDVIQTWLDVSTHPARGAEQADYIWDRVLKPQLLKED